MMADGPILLQKDNTFTKLFVGGLPYHTNDEALREFFLQYGEIEEAVVIHDRITGKSKGYGFVTMKDREGAEKACANPNPVVDGRRANVNLAYLGAKPKSHSHPGSPLNCFPLGRSDSPSALFPGPHSPPHGLPVMGPPFFLPPPPPPPFFDGPPGPFSPPPSLLSPILYPPYFNNQQPLGFLPPPIQPFLPQPQLVPYNSAN